MKKVFTVIFCFSFFLSLAAQSNVDLTIKQFEKEIDKNVGKSSREYYLDLPARVTKVVLAEDNSMADLILKNAIEKGWNISPFEFCDYEEFERLKCDTNYYFLLRIDVEPQKGRGVDMEFITYVKGSAKASEGIEKMPELISLPMFDKDDQDGRVFTYMPAYVNIIQNYIQKIADGKIYPGLRFSIKTNKVENATDYKILFCKEDLAYDYTVKRYDMFDGHSEVVASEVVENAMADGTAGTLVSLVVAPSEPVKGAYCYKMLISADTYELYYYDRHKITRKRGIGFIKEDIKKLSMPFRLVNRDE